MPADQSTIEVPLTRGLVTLIDESDADLVLPFRWHATRNGNTFYVHRRGQVIKCERAVVSLHRWLLGLTDGHVHVDHANRNGLDNRRSNLRVCSHAQNQANRAKQRTHAGRPTSSIHKGVSWDVDARRWRAHIQINGVLKHIGRFRTEIEAAIKYDKAATALFGEFALLNFPIEPALNQGDKR